MDVAVDDVSKLLADITPALTFRATCKDISELDPADYGTGDIIVNTATNSTYLKVDTHWEELGGYNDLPSDRTLNDYRSEPELKETKCESCGAPVKIKSKYDTGVKCEYCGTEYNVSWR